MKTIKYAASRERAPAEPLPFPHAETVILYLFLIRVISDFNFLKTTFFIYEYNSITSAAGSVGLYHQQIHIALQVQTMASHSCVNHPNPPLDVITSEPTEVTFSVRIYYGPT